MNLPQIKGSEDQKRFKVRPLALNKLLKSRDYNLTDTKTNTLENIDKDQFDSAITSPTVLKNQNNFKGVHKSTIFSPKKLGVGVHTKGISSVREFKDQNMKDHLVKQTFGKNKNIDTSFRSNALKATEPSTGIPSNLDALQDTSVSINNAYRDDEKYIG